MLINPREREHRLSTTAARRGTTTTQGALGLQHEVSAPLHFEGHFGGRAAKENHDAKRENPCRHKFLLLTGCKGL